MDIIIGKTAGFCFGVKNAVTKTEEALEDKKNIYCLGELVHNSQVTKELQEKGVKFIEKIEQAKEKMIIRSHGVEKGVYQKAKELKIELIDLTCPKVLHIHKIAQEYTDKDYYIILIGKAEHPEMVGTISFCGNYYYIIENAEQVSEAIERFKQTGKEKILVISQTTYSLEKFNQIVKNIKSNVKKEILEIKNTICNATKERQEETEKIAKQVDKMVIVGGKHSSNSNKLYELANKYCRDVVFVETEEEIEIETFRGKNKVGVMAGASTPEKSIQKVVEKIQSVC